MNKRTRYEVRALEDEHGEWYEVTSPNGLVVMATTIEDRADDYASEMNAILSEEEECV